MFLERVALSWWGPFLHLLVALFCAGCLVYIHKVGVSKKYAGDQGLPLLFFMVKILFQIGMAFTLLAARNLVYGAEFAEEIEEDDGYKVNKSARHLTHAIDWRRLQKSLWVSFLGYAIFWLFMLGVPLKVPWLLIKAANKHDAICLILIAFYLCDVAIMVSTSFGWHAAMSWCLYFSHQMADTIGDRIKKDDIDWRALVKKQHNVSVRMYKLWRKASFMYAPYLASITSVAIVSIVCGIRCFRRSLWTDFVIGCTMSLLCCGVAVEKFSGMAGVTRVFMSTSPLDESIISLAISKYGTWEGEKAKQQSDFVQYLLNTPTGALFLGVLVDYSFVVRLVAGSGTTLSAIISGLVAFHARSAS